MFFGIQKEHKYNLGDYKYMSMHNHTHYKLKRLACEQSIQAFSLSLAHYNEQNIMEGKRSLSQFKNMQVNVQ